MMKRIRHMVIGLITGSLAIWQVGWAMTPLQLRTSLDQRETMTIIDVRNTSLYREGHIPGAINIPSAIIARKRLPAIGQVVVYGDGIRPDLTRAAVEELNSRRGINAEMMEGGFSAWEALSQPTTLKKGLDRKRIRYLTYQEFEKAASGNPDIILIDLRAGSSEGKMKKFAASSDNPPRTDLSEKFPRHHTVELRSSGKKWDIAPAMSHKRDRANHKFFVLIDGGNGESEVVARRLKAAGIKQVAILTGGEKSLCREGHSGWKKEKIK